MSGRGGDGCLQGGGMCTVEGSSDGVGLGNGVEVRGSRKGFIFRQNVRGARVGVEARKWTG